MTPSKSPGPQNAVFLRGDGFFLRPLTETDADGPWASWLNDQELTHYMSNGTWPVTRDDQVSYYRDSLNSRSTLLLAICSADDARHVGNIVLNGIDFLNRRAEIGVIVGDKSASGRGIGWKSIRLLSGHAFDRLNLHKVWARVESGNAVAAKAFERAGLVREAVLKEEILHHGTWRDSIYLGLLEGRYRELIPGSPASPPRT